MPRGHERLEGRVVISSFPAAIRMKTDSFIVKIPQLFENLVDDVA